MISRILLSGLLVSVILALGLRAQQATTPTTLGTPPPTLLAPGGQVTVDLRAFLGVPGVTGQVVQFDTVRGTFNAELLANDAPRTVANFLNYVNRGAYTNSIFHRSVRNFVIQGGGFAVSGSTVNTIPTDAPIALENKVSNLRGTMAMARTNDLNSATSQWFVNTGNNAGQLDTTNGGYTVFARVLGNGMTVADSIAALTIFDASAILNSAFNELPLLGLPANPANLVVVRSVRPVPIYPARTSLTRTSPVRMWFTPT
jgi:cyclophilin family peptidyl-prolyl cis-trans isomerase